MYLIAYFCSQSTYRPFRYYSVFYLIKTHYFLFFTLAFSLNVFPSQLYVLLEEGTHQVEKRMAGVTAFKE